ncbi:DUF808 family protein, partial [Novosphingobium sp.]|uniref:DUF808 family protein n=1 Tax=Novosphingobium sp. TaxID=1874826 RepID=UPI0026010414
YEGAEKIMEKLGGAEHGQTLDDPITDVAQFEKERVSGAVRTDLILSAEIMAIALAAIADTPLVQRGIVLALVGIAITVLVYGTVALIVKMDDIGLHMVEKRRTAAAKAVGRGLLRAMPKVLTLLSVVGTGAMLWVGGGIILDGLEDLGVHGPAGLAHAVQHAVEQATGPVGGPLGWLTYAVASALVGVILGWIVATVLHHGQKAVRR